MANRLVYLVLDALSLDFVQAHRQHLPQFDRLLSQSPPRSLRSPATVASASVWPTFVQGTLPGEHGEYFPMQWDAASMGFRRTDRGGWFSGSAGEPFWYAMARQGIPCLVLDAAHVHPAAAVPCTEVINWSYQSSGQAFSQPPRLLAQLERRFGRRPIGPEVPVPKGRRRLRAIRDALIRSLRAKADALLWLADTHSWRFLLAGFYELHRAGHNAWPIEADFASEAEPDSLLAVTLEADHQLGRLIERFDDGHTQIVVMALHGMEPNRAQDHFLAPILSRLNARWLGQDAPSPRESRGFNPVGALRRTLPFDLQYRAVHLLGETVQDWVVNRAMTGGLDWRRTPAFPALGGGEGYIRLNLQGREREGCLAPAEVPAFLTFLERELLSIRVADGDGPLIGQLRRLPELFPGPLAHRLPDLCAIWAPAEPATAIVSPTLGRIEARLATGRGGNHEGSAFLMVAGRQEGADGALEAVEGIEDLGRYASTWLGADLKAPPG